MQATINTDAELRRAMRSIRPGKRVILFVREAVLHYHYLVKKTSNRLKNAAGVGMNNLSCQYTPVDIYWQVDFSNNAWKRFCTSPCFNTTATEPMNEQPMPEVVTPDMWEPFELNDETMQEFDTLCNLIDTDIPIMEIGAPIPCEISQTTNDNFTSGEELFTTPTLSTSIESAIEYLAQVLDS